MKNYLVLTFGLMISLTVNADLRDQARQEKRWSSIEIQYTPGQLAATGYLTENNGWKLRAIAPEINMSSALSSSYAESMGLERFTKLCSKIGYGFAAVGELKRKHTITLSLPKWSDAVKGVVGPQVLKLLKVRSKVAFDVESNTLRYSRVDPRTIERSVESQVQAQMDALRVEGQVEIDLTGQDYVACDFIAGTAHLGLDVVWEFPAAKVKRQAVVKPEELLRAVTESKTMFDGAVKCVDSLVISSALLSANLVSITKKSMIELGAAGYIQLFNSSYDFATCRLRDPQSIQLAEVAQEFDRLTLGNDQNASLVMTRFNGEIK